MCVADVVEQFRRLSNPERLEVIEAATRLIREELRGRGTAPEDERDRRLRQAALAAKDLNEPVGGLTEWADLDAEASRDDTIEMA